MDGNGYCRPGSCQPGGIYYLRFRGVSGETGYRRVEFLGYRPHPAELLVRDGNRVRMIYREDLFCLEKDPDAGVGPEGRLAQ